MRRYDVPEPYENLKELTRGKKAYLFVGRGAGRVPVLLFVRIVALLITASMISWQVDAEGMQLFVQSLDVPDNVKQELMQLTPHNYTGLAPDLAQKV